MSQELERLLKIVEGRRCWGDEPSPELIERIEEERRKLRPSQELQDTLTALRQLWFSSAGSTKRDRHIPFLGELYREVQNYRYLKTLDDLKAGLTKFYDVDPFKRDAYSMLLVAVCGPNLSRKVRSTWAACLRTVERNKTPKDLGAAQILRLGGINRCAQR